MNIYLHELKTYRINTLIWILSLSGFMVMMMCFYPLIKDDMDTFMELINNFPPAMKAIMGVVYEDFSSPIGFYGYIFTYVGLIEAIQAMNLGVGIVSKEERERTADFLMTKPVARKTIMTAKVLTAATIFFLTNIIYSIGTYAMLAWLSEGEVDIKHLFLMNLSLLIMQFIFFSIGLAVTGFLKKVRAVLPISMGMIFTFYAISAFAVTSKEDKLRYATPFQYFTVQQIFEESSYEVSFLILSGAIIIIGIVLSYYRYLRKNIPAV